MPSYVFPDAPKRWTGWPRSNMPIVGGGMIHNADISQIYNHYARQDPALQNDAFTQGVWLRDGTYTFYALGIASTSYGQITWYLDNVAFITNQEWYNPGAVYGLVQSGPVTISNGLLYHVLKGVVASKNASSAGYNLLLSKLWFKQATD